MEGPYSNKHKEFTIKEGCPWYEAQQAYGPPNVNWCEPTICSVINEPANTWSNLGYILLGLALIKKLKTKPIKAFPYIVFVMGVASAIYHASNNYLTQYFDFVGMYLMMSFLLAWNIRRHLNSVGFYSLYWFLFSLNTTIFMIFDIVNWPVQPTILLNALPIILLDLWAGYKEKRLKDYSLFALAIVSLVVAQAFAILDIKRIWCNPENLFLHGHVIWHILGSFGMVFAGLHMARITRKS